MRKLLPIFLLLSGLAVSATAAYYSIFGLSKLFAGASMQVVIMATALEIAKLVIASAVYRYWSIISPLLKTYLTTAVVLLVLITSLGVYGFLSSAYEQTANVDKIATMQIERIEANLERFESQKQDLETEKKRVLNDIDKLRTGVTTVLGASETAAALRNASQNRKLVQKQLDDAVKSRDALDIKLGQVVDSIYKYEGQVIEAKAANDTAAELGPLKYLSRLTGVDMDKIVNWFILLLVLVFDPLAVSLLIASSSILLNLSRKNERQEVLSSVPALPPSQGSLPDENGITPESRPVESEVVVEDVIEELDTRQEESAALQDPQPQVPERPDIYQDSVPDSKVQDKTKSPQTILHQLRSMSAEQRKNYISKLLQRR